MDGNGETPIFHEMIWFVIQLKQPIRLAGGLNYFYFHPYFPGVSWSNLTSAYFSSGLVQPPTSRWLFGKAGAPQCWPQTPQSPVTQALGMLKKKRWEADRLVRVFSGCTYPNHMRNAWEGIYNPPEASDGSPLGVRILWGRNHHFTGWRGWWQLQYVLF